MKHGSCDIGTKVEGTLSPATFTHLCDWRWRSGGGVVFWNTTFLLWNCRTKPWQCHRWVVTGLKTLDRCCATHLCNMYGPMARTWYGLVPTLWRQPCTQWHIPLCG